MFDTEICIPFDSPKEVHTFSHIIVRNLKKLIYSKLRGCSFIQYIKIDLPVSSESTINQHQDEPLSDNGENAGSGSPSHAYT